MRSYMRSLEGDYNKRHTVEGILVEHWAAWKDRLLRISQGQTGLSSNARGLAALGHELMCFFVAMMRAFIFDVGLSLS